MERRTYRQEDYEAVCDFLIALNETDRAHINWNWARFEWMVEHPDCDRSLLGTIGLWTEGGRIVGAAIYDMWFGEAFTGVLPGYEALYPDVLTYAYDVLKDDAGLKIGLPDERAWEIAAAVRAGFSEDTQTETIQRLALDRPQPYAMPDGLHFVSLDPIKDADALGFLFWQGFDHGEDRVEYERQRPEETPRMRRHFQPQLSVAAAYEDGEPVACCCVWVHPKTAYAYVEPVCTIPSYRGVGAGRAVVLEALNRARSFGAKEAYVISDQVFYQKLGFAFDRHYTFYRKA